MPKMLPGVMKPPMKPSTPMPATPMPGATPVPKPRIPSMGRRPSNNPRVKGVAAKTRPMGGRKSY